MFESIAGRYDLLNHLLSCNQDKRWRRRAVRLLSPRRGERILDLCCGTGDLAFECLRQQPSCRVIAADFALAMLQIAARKRNDDRAMRERDGAAKKAHMLLPSPRVLAGDALRLPFGEGAFDAVAVAFGARNFENTRDGLCEIARVLRPGGRVLILEFMRPTSPLLQHGFGLFFQHVLPLVGRAVSRHDCAYNYLPASVNGFFTRREFENLLRETGFSRIRSFDYNGGIATSFLAQKEN